MALKLLKIVPAFMYLRYEKNYYSQKELCTVETLVTVSRLT